MASRNGSQAVADGIRLGFSAARPVDSTPNPVVTSSALAGFAGGRRPHAPGGRTAIPAAFRYAPAVSRRTPVSCSMRRSGDPSRPRGNHLLFCRFAQDVAHIDEGYMPHAEINVPGLTPVGRFSDPHWPVLGDP
jgi:hypothetical protein